MIFKKIITFFSLFILICSPPAYSGEKKEKWHELRQHPIYLVCLEKDVKNGENIIGFAHKKFIKISSDLGFLSEKNIYIIIAPTINYFNQITDGKLPEWSGGAAVPSQSTIFLKSPRITNPDVNIKKILVHELAHIGLYSATGGQNLMKWFEEGFAQYYSGELNMNNKILMAKRLLTGNFLPLKKIDDVLNFRESEASLAYGEALAAVSYLIEIEGLEAFKIFIRNLKQTGDMNLAMHTAFGIGLHEFETEWIMAMKRRYLWLIIFDYRLIISILFIVLFLFAYLIKIKNTRKIKQNWEKEDIENFQTYEENPLDQDNSIQN